VADRGRERAVHANHRRQGDDAVEVRTEKGRAVFSVKSPFGISHAAIERTGATWPDAVVLRLHLKGLSNS